MKTCIAAISLAFSLSLHAETELTQINTSFADASRYSAGATGNGDPSAYANRGPKYAFDGSGLTAGKHVADTVDNTMFMLSSADKGSFPWYIQVDLGSTQRLDAVRIYNFNFAKDGNSYTTRGVKNYQLYVSTAASWRTSSSGIQEAYRLVKEGTLDEASGTADEAGEYITLDEPVNARYFALVAIDDFDDNFANLNYNGVSEIQLFSGGEPLEEEPEPPEVDTEVIVDNADATGVEIHGTWKESTSSADRIGANYIHNSGDISADNWVRFTPTLTSNAVYKVSLYWNCKPSSGVPYDDARGTNVPVVVTYSGGVATNYVDMSVKTGAVEGWCELGSWPFAVGTGGSVQILTEGVAAWNPEKPANVIADAVKFAITDDPVPERTDGILFFVR